MSKVYAQASVSLDGFIAGPDGTGFDHLFAWCTAGDETPSAQPDRLTYPTNAATATYLRSPRRHLRGGRRSRLFDATNG